MAGEQLVMPFACRVAGGQVSLVPSAPRAYEIYGSREQKRLTTCSPYDPRKCHNWSVYRFDLDCGGVTTSWQSVVNALSPILAESVGTPGDAYGAPAYPPRGLARPYRPGPGGGIAFPRGFAPNPMRVARFEQIEVAPATIPLPPKKPPAPAPTQVAEMEPSPEPAPEPRTLDGDADAPTETTPVEDKGEDKTTKVTQHQALQIEIDSASSEVTGALPKPGSGSLWRDASLVFAVTIAALLALTTTLVLRRRKLEALPGPIAQRLVGRAKLPAHRPASIARRESTAADKQRDVPARRMRLWDENWLPATVSEALDVLGVDPAAGRDKIKSTVTRLRRALHPDHAFDDEDRGLRERRLKQINVAWEIIAGKRRAPWLAAKPPGS